MKTVSDVMCSAAKADKEAIIQAAKECCQSYTGTTQEQCMVASFLHSPLGMEDQSIKELMGDVDVVALRVYHDSFMRDDKAYATSYQAFRRKAMSVVLQNMVS